VAAIALVLAIGGANLLRADIVQRYIDDARAELPTNPAATIVDAGRALRLDSTDLDAYYLKAAGLARFNYAMSARATLLAAARTDPTSFVTLTLLGDLEVRAGDWQAAQSYYRRAHMLNPRDASLAASAANPRSAEPG
jgi:predicted Zn-dependent protease